MPKTKPNMKLPTEKLHKIDSHNQSAASSIPYLDTPRHVLTTECKFISSEQKTGLFSRSKWHAGLAKLHDFTLTLHKIKDSKANPPNYEIKPAINIPLRTYTASFSPADAKNLYDSSPIIMTLTSELSKMHHKIRFDTATIALDWCNYLRNDICKKVGEVPPSLSQIDSSSSLHSQYSETSTLVWNGKTGLFDQNSDQSVAVNETNNTLV